jgi:hypothetical protein
MEEEFFDISKVEPGLVALYFLVTDTLNSMVGQNWTIMAFPDEKGETNGTKGVVVNVVSNTFPDLTAGMLVPYETESIMHIKEVLIMVMAQLISKEMERVQSEESGGIILPEKKIYVPGQN